MLYPKNKEKELSDILFKNPGSEYRAAPFWAWNCKLNEDMLLEQIEYLKEMGFGGFYMHTRAGMETPYLGEEFMNMVRSCVQKAKDEDMLAYLYDEDKWPSGYAGGLVTKNHKYRAKHMLFTQKKLEHLPLEEAVEKLEPYLLAVYDIFLNENGELTGYSVIDEDTEPNGKKWYAYMMTAKDTARYNGQAYVDTLDKASMDNFIDITYEAYKREVGDDFGTAVPAMFTDEPQFKHKGALGFADSNADAIYPWTPLFEESFKAKYNYSMLDYFPEVVWDLPNREASCHRYHYHDHVTELFTNSFAKNCGDWCGKNNLHLTGHMVQEDTLGAQANSIGEAMRAYPHFQIPGIDLLCNEIRFATLKQCQSAVHQQGNEAMMTELYGVTNWDFDFRGHKFQGDWQAALGATMRVPHLSWVSMAGEAKRDYPASISYQSPWYKEYKYIEDHFARLNTALTRGVPKVDVAVIHPIESYWINLGPAESSADVLKQLDERFLDILNWMLYGTVDFDFICESTLPSQVKASASGLQVGVMNYKTVIVPDCITLRKTTLEILEKFKENGGNVIFAGNCPKYIDAVKSDAAEALYNKSVVVPYNRTDILAALKDSKIVDIKNSTGIPTDNLIYQMREDNTCSWLFIANAKHMSDEHPFIPDRKEKTNAQHITISIDGMFVPTLYDTLDGTIKEIPYEIKSGKTIINYARYQSDSILLNLVPTDVNSSLMEKIAENKTPSKTIRFMKKVPYTLAEDNVLLLDRAEYSLNGEPFHEEEEILILDNICRKIKDWPLRMDVTPQPWTLEEKEIEDYIDLRFTIYSDISVEGTKLAVEDAEKLVITFNGETVDNTPVGFFTDKAIKTVALPEIKKGENILTLHVPFGQRTNTEWCYILGNFNVKVEGTIATIIPPTDTIGFSSITSQGLPFYGGNITYNTTIETPKCKAKIHSCYYRGATIKILVDGKETSNATFSPYATEVELSAGIHNIDFILYGNRINSFGGVHNVIQQRWVGADFWRTKGDEWCYEYVLKDFGIMASPIIEIFED